VTDGTHQANIALLGNFMASIRATDTAARPSTIHKWPAACSHSSPRRTRNIARILGMPLGRRGSEAVFNGALLIENKGSGISLIQDLAQFGHATSMDHILFAET
jgi:hypothetical protein